MAHDAQLLLELALEKEGPSPELVVLDMRSLEQFEECDFTKAKLGSSGASGTLFRRCRFDGADLRGAHLMNCTFEACTFAETRFGKGSLAGSAFVASELPTELLADTILDRVRGL